MSSSSSGSSSSGSSGDTSTKPSLFDLFVNSSAGFASDLEDDDDRRARAKHGVDDDDDDGSGDRQQRPSVLPPPRPAANVGSLQEGASRRLYHTGVETPYQRHQRYIRDYVLYYGGGKLPPVPQPPIKTDDQILQKQYRFIRTEEDDQADTATEAWEKKLARRYYERLYKEYCIADLTRYREGQIGMRWRVEKEVIVGKGQFICGNKHCDAKEDLKSYEVDFCYSEAGQTKNALVKLRLCPDCAYKLNYKKEKQRRKEEKKRKRKAEKEDRKLRKRLKKEGREDEIEKMERRKKREQEEQEERERAERELKEEAEREAERAKNVWKKDSTQVEQAKNRSDEFDDYFRGLFP